MDEYNKTKFDKRSLIHILKTNNLAELSKQDNIVQKFQNNLIEFDRLFYQLINDISKNDIKEYYVCGNNQVEGDDLVYIINKIKKNIFQNGGDIQQFTSLDFVQLGLDIAGYIPTVGIPFDMTSMIISIIRENYVDAMFSFISIIPIVGSFIGTTGKYTLKYIEYIENAKKESILENDD